MNYPQRVCTARPSWVCSTFPTQPTGRQRAVISWYGLSVAKPGA